MLEQASLSSHCMVMTSAHLHVGLPVKICYQTPPFRSIHPRRVLRRRTDNQLTRAAPTDSVDEFVLHTFLPSDKGPGEESSDDCAEDSVLQKRVQVLRDQLQSDAKGSQAASTSASSPDHQDLLARVTHQLQRFSPNRLSPRVRGLVLLNILVLLCGANWVVLKETEDFFDPFTFAALRFTLAAAVFSPWVKGAAQDSTIIRGGLELGMFSALAYMTQSVGLVTSDASRASFISTFTVLVVPILAGLSGRGVKPLTWASCIVALVGVGLLEQGGAPPGVGDVWNLLSALFFGLQVFRTEHYSHAIKTSKSSGPLGLIAIIVSTIAAVALVLTAIVHPGEIQNTLLHPQQSFNLMMSPQFPWRQIAFTGLLSTDFVIYIELIALHDVTSTDAAIVYTLEPVLGATLAYLLLGERWGPAGWVGAGLIVASSLTTQIFGQPDIAPPDAHSD
ncbi:MAG: hypothetical protein FRX49_00811 [Trebouxia sp. A1-2]|nr:MAG: hypothetical protein FRX49_00811 [Trebouxia sp. A1-2]